jgi:uncharacterized metal-binding protein YceD (DUF177 family)
MLIDLKSIDENGKDYNFDELSDETRGAFSDLLGETPFQIELFIRPMGNTYQVQGQVKSQYHDVCSQCGYDIDLPLKNTINEIIVIEKQRPRNTQVSQSKQNFDSQAPSVTYINDSQFDLTEFLHEMVATGLDIYPRCPDTQLCESRRFTEPIIEPEERKGHPGFAALKNLKVTKH